MKLEQKQRVCESGTEECVKRERREERGLQGSTEERRSRDERVLQVLLQVL